MEADVLVKVIWSILAAIGVTGLGLLSIGVKRLISVTFENTVQIRILNEKIADIIKGQLKVEKIERDLNEAHNRIRHMEPQKYNRNGG